MRSQLKAMPSALYVVNEGGLCLPLDKRVSSFEQSLRKSDIMTATAGSPPYHSKPEYSIIMLNIAILSILMLAVAATDLPETAPANPVLEELLEKGVTLSDGKAYKLPPPSMGDGLTAAEQKAVIEKIGKVEKLSFRGPDRRTHGRARGVDRSARLKESDDESSTVRAIDLWFIAHGKWDVLNSKEFLDSLSKSKDGENKNEVVSKSGIPLRAGNEKTRPETRIDAGAGDEIRLRHIFALRSGRTERDAVGGGHALENLAHRRGENGSPASTPTPNIPTAGGRSFATPTPKSPTASRNPTPAAAPTRKSRSLSDPADSIFVECHLIYEEPYGWFEGGEMLNSKLPVIVKSKVRSFRSKLSIASEKKIEK